MEVREIINSILPLPDYDLTLIEQIAEEITVPKNHTLIHAGQTARYLYFQKNGICRIFYTTEDREVVLGFAFSGDLLLSLKSYIHEQPGYETIQTLEESSVIRIPTDSLFALYRTHNRIANWGRKLAELEALKIEERLMRRLFRPAKERYQDLFDQAPSLIQRIKLGYIASYLGISQVTLSRIRGLKH